MSSQESCGSENGLLGSRPRRGDVQYQGNGGGGGGYQQYSSQDSLPDSPYSSQSLDSHAGQTTGSDDQTFFMVMMGISFFFGQLNAIVEAMFSQTTGHRFISLQCVCSLSLFLGLYYVIINTWMSTITSSKVILKNDIFSDTRRSMPNLNKMRGGRVGSHQPPSSNPAYGLSQVGHRICICICSEVSMHFSQTLFSRSLS